MLLTLFGYAILVGAGLRLGRKLADYFVHRVVNPLLFKLGVSWGL